MLTIAGLVTIIVLSIKFLSSRKKNKINNVDQARRRALRRRRARVANEDLQVIDLFTYNAMIVTEVDFDEFILEQNRDIPEKVVQETN